MPSAAESRPALPLSARGLLAWCLAGALAIQVFLYFMPRTRFSPVFSYLLHTGDATGNWVLLMLACCAYVLRNRAAGIIAAVRFTGSRPWLMAAALFPLLCLGTLRIYHDQPLSMDEYAAVFQAKVFAAGRLTGAYPPDLLHLLIPVQFHGLFLTVSRVTGEVSTSYWPGFALLMAPFVWLNATWALNPAIGALALPAIHRLAREVSGSRDAAAWAVALTVASPVFIVDSISFYSMQAHLLLNVSFALLLLRPTVPRAAAAGLVGSFALVLHQPVPHLLFLVPFAVWLALRRETRGALAALAIGYLPLGILIGFGWQMHLGNLAHAGAAAAAKSAGPSLAQASIERVSGTLVLPGMVTVWARVAGLVKVWAWGAAGLMVLAAAGYAAMRSQSVARLLGAAALVTFFGYFLFPLDQGHGWGYRYFHSAWFVLPVLAAAALYAARGASGDELRGMAAWLVALSFIFANAIRLAEVRAFTADHLAQVPPLSRKVPEDVRQVVFVRNNFGSYVGDLVQNDPFMRGARTIMVYEGPDRAADLMRRRFPGYVKEFSGDWGELWTARQPTPGR